MHESTKGMGIKQRLINEVRRLIGIFIYLSIFFFVFRLYTRLLMSEFQIDYVEYGLTLVKALVLAKIILTAEALQLGERFRDQPLIVPTIYCTIVFAIFAAVGELAEHFGTGMIFGHKSAAELLAEIRDQGWPHIAAMTLVTIVAFLPFFAFRELERVLGEGKVRDLFIKERVAEEGKGN